MKLRAGWAAMLLAAMCAQAQQAPSPAASQAAATIPSCPKAAEVLPAHLYGFWRAEFEGLAQGATLLFEKHPEMEGSVRGGINRSGTLGQVAGDADDGAFTLEESDDGKRISATWTGDVVEGSCGREIRGSWQDAAGNPARAFVLRKQQGW